MFSKLVGTENYLVYIKQQFYEYVDYSLCCPAPNTCGDIGKMTLKRFCEHFLSCCVFSLFHFYSDPGTSFTERNSHLLVGRYIKQQDI